MLDRSIDLGPCVPEPDDDVVICRCEEITKVHIRQAVHEGLFTMTEVKRFTRAGMGLCQGQTCGRLVKIIVEQELKKTIPASAEPALRPPMRPISLAAYGNEVIP
jgi:NAD(P)H-nitrite reductase large subunit